MPATSLLARLGLRIATLGSAASLAIAAPVAEGDVSQSAHTNATRTGVYFPTPTSIGVVVSAVESVRFWDDGGVQIGGAFGVSPGVGVLQTAGLVITPAALPGAPVPGTIVIDDAGALNVLKWWDGAVWNSAGGGGGTPAGLDTQIQYNNAGAFGGAAGFTYTQAGVVIAQNQAGLVLGDAWVALDVSKRVTASLQPFDDCFVTSLTVLAQTNLNKVWATGYNNAIDVAAVVIVGDLADGGDYTGSVGMKVGASIYNNLTAGKNVNMVYVSGLEVTTALRNLVADIGTITLSDAVYGIYAGGAIDNTIVPSVYEVYIGMTADASAVITDWYGIYMGVVGGGSITNLYGIYQADPAAINVLKGLFVLDASENHAITEVAVDTVLGFAYHTILVDATGGPVNIDLPDSTATGNINGRIYSVKKIDASANAVSVRRSGATDLIDGATVSTLTAQYQSRSYQCSSTSAAANRWSII